MALTDIVTPPQDTQIIEFNRGNIGVISDIVSGYENSTELESTVTGESDYSYIE